MAPLPVYTHQVIRAFGGAIRDKPYQPGDLVDATQWRNKMQLVRLRYLDPLPPGWQPTVVVAPPVSAPPAPTGGFPPIPMNKKGRE